MRGGLALALLFLSLAGCSDGGEAPAVPDAPDEAGPVTVPLSVRVCLEACGPTVEGAIVYVAVGDRTQTATTGADGVATVRVPVPSEASIEVLGPPGTTSERGPTLTLDNGTGPARADVVLYPEFRTVALDLSWTHSGLEGGEAVTAPVRFHEDEGIHLAYEQRIRAVHVLLAWNNTATSFVDLLPCVATTDGAVHAVAPSDGTEPATGARRVEHEFTGSEVEPLLDALSLGGSLAACARSEGASAAVEPVAVGAVVRVVLDGLTDLAIVY